MTRDSNPLSKFFAPAAPAVTPASCDNTYPASVELLFARADLAELRASYRAGERGEVERLGREAAERVAALTGKVAS